MSSLVYASDAMARQHKALATALRVGSDVLVVGETGSGKESLVRQALVEVGAGRPVEEFRAAEIASELQRAEWSGVMRGAYTGSDRDRAGCLERADGGFLIISDCEQLSLDMQRTLRLFHDDRKVQRMGSVDRKRVNVQILVTTNADLRDPKLFMQDLYWRLSRIVIFVPPLRERREDLDVLVPHLLSKLSARCGRTLTGLDDASWSYMRSHPWPGNVRELENALWQAALHGEGPVLSLDVAASESARRRRARPTRDEVARALAVAPTRAAAAELLQVCRRTLYSLCLRFGL